MVGARRTCLAAAMLQSALIFATAPAIAADTTGVRPAAFTLSATLKDIVAARPHLSGPPLRRAALDGHVVVLSFFASWCPPCHIEFEHLADLRRQYKDRKVTIVAINQFEDFSGFTDGGKRLGRFLSRHRPDFPVIRGNDAIAGALGPVTRIPTVFVFAPDGRATLHFVHRQGAKQTNPSAKKLQRAIEEAD